MAEESTLRRTSLKLRALNAVRNGNTEEGIDLYKKYLEIPENVNDDNAWAGLGGAYRRIDDIGQAIQCYEKAFAINAQSTYALVNLVSLAAAKGDEAIVKAHIAQAERLTQRIIESGDADHWTWFDLATLQLLRGDQQSAETNFRFAAKMPSCTAVNVGSAVSNLEFLKERNPELAKSVNKVLRSWRNMKIHLSLWLKEEQRH